MSSATILPFAGGEMSSFDPLDASCFERTNTDIAGQVGWDSAYSRCAIKAGTGCNSPTWPAAPTFWYHELLRPSATLTGFGATPPEVETLALYDGATKVLSATVGLGTASGGNTWTIYTLQAAVLTSVGKFVTTNGINQTLDIKLVAGGSGSIDVYFSGTRIIGASGLNHSGFTGVTQIGQRGGAGGGAQFSEVIGDTVSHIGDRLKTFPIDTNSATNTGWAGSVTDINEVVYSDANFINAASAGLISTFYANGFSLTGLTVVAVVLGARTNCGASGPQNLELVIRTAAANYASGTPIALNAGYQACSWPWPLDPATMAAWTAANAQAIEGGPQSDA